MNFAIIENNIVTNIAFSNEPLNQNWYLIPTGMLVCIGDTFDGNAFYDPDGNIRLTIESMTVKENVTALEDTIEAENTLLKAQVQALSDRNDFLEDCIAEMAGLIYA